VAPLTEPAQTGDLLRREDYYTAQEVATEKCEKPAFLLCEITSTRTRTQLRLDALRLKASRRKRVNDPARVLD